MKTFSNDDQLNRGKFADFLLHLINHRSTYKRDSQSRNYSIAIDGSYGSGKTYFLEMFENKLRETKSFNIIHYNAWEYDIYQDAISPFLYLLEHEDLFIAAQNEQERAKRTEKLHNIIKSGLIAATAIAGKAILGSSFDTIIDQVKNTSVTELTKDEKSEFEKKLTIFSGFKQALEECCSEEYPLVFLVDELDRCSPEFALKTFEVVKHLIDVPNVIFIFALDITQLKSAIHRFYGENIDADGYIFKLFDYIAILPHPSVASYIKEKSERIDAKLTKSASFQQQALTLTKQCSLREIDTLFCVYHLLWETKLHAYAEEEAWCLYFYLLFLKYKHRDCFFILLKETGDIPDSIQPKLLQYGNLQPTHSLFSYSRLTMNRNNFEVSYVDKGKNRLVSVDAKNKTVNVRESPNSMLTCCIYFSNQLPGKPYTIHNLFFWEDFQNILDADEHLTFGQYLHQQLEMFDFCEALS